MARMIIDLQKGLIEIEGDEKFVERIYSDFRESTLEKLSQRTFENVGSDEKQPVTDGETTFPKKSRRRKAGGPSCASRIEILKDEGFFGAARSPAEVREKLSEKGSTYESKNVAAALTDLIKAAKLRRFKDNGNWMYQKP